MSDNKPSFLVKILEDTKDLYEVRTSPPANEEAYYFLLIPPHKIAELEKLFGKNAEIDLRDYGEVVEMGFGEPSDDLLKELKKKYKVA